MKYLWTLILISLCGPVWAGDPLLAVLEEGRLLLDMRYRLESVDVDGIPQKALASTLRTRLGFETAAWKGFTVLGEVENVTVLGGETYNSTANGRTIYPVVADPEDTEVNRIQLTYTGWKDQRLILGRQRLVLDNHRFVGNVGWRQNEQTFDAATWQFTPNQNVALTLSYLANANRIFGEHHPSQGDLRLNAYLIHCKLPKLPIGKLSVFAHFIENEDVPLLSHQNLGFYLDGDFKVNERFSVVHEWSYVSQTHYRDGSDFIDVDYYRVGIGPKFGNVVIKANLENLGTNEGNYGFSTPLATLHGFNGWADLFLNTPLAGLKDKFLSIQVKRMGWTLVGAYHQFESDFIDSDYGLETDLLLTKKLGDRALVGLKGANYQAEDFGADTRKVWAYGQWIW